MPLIIGTTPHSQWRALNPLLNHLGWKNQQENPETDYELTANVDENAKILLLHSRPELAVAHAMDAGASPEEALAEWRSAAEQLLGYYKKQRRKAVMVDADSAANSPRKLTRWLRENRPAFCDQIQGAWPEAPAAAPGASTELSIPAPANPLNQLLATQLVAQDQSLPALMAQLEAASIPLADSTQPELDVAALHAELAQQPNAPRVEEENNLLLTQLHKVQEELENYYHKAQNGSKTSQELEAQTQQLTKEKQNLEAELKASEDALNKERAQSEEKNKSILEENDLILKQLFKVQEELEKYYLEGKAKTEALDATKKQLSKAEASATKLKKELSTEKQHSAGLAKQLKNLERDNHDLNVEKYQLNAELALAQIELRTAEKKLHFVQHSTSWRLTHPLRKAARLVHKPSRGRELIESHIQLIKQSDLFDAKWYLNNNSDLQAKGTDPAEHYVMYGGAEGRAPSPRFDAKSYLQKNPDVAESGQNPLVHYLLHGKAEGRKP